MSFPVFQGGSDDAEKYQKKIFLEELLLIASVTYRTYVLNGGSQTRRDQVNYYRELYPEKDYEVIYTGYTVTIKRKEQ